MKMWTPLRNLNGQNSMGVSTSGIYIFFRLFFPTPAPSLKNNLYPFFSVILIWGFGGRAPKKLLLLTWGVLFHHIFSPALVFTFSSGGAFKWKICIPDEYMSFIKEAWLDVPIDYPLYIIFLRYNKDIHMYCINQYNNDYLAQSLSYFFCQEYVDYNTSIPIDLCNVFYFRNILNEAYHLLSIYLKLIRKYS